MQKSNFNARDRFKELKNISYTETDLGTIELKKKPSEPIFI